MKVFNQDNPNQTLSLIPRVEPFGLLFLIITDEDTKETESDLTYSYTYLNGILLLSDLDITILKEGHRYSLELKNSDEKVIYRGLAISTNQTPQDYSITKDVFIYG